MAHSDALVQAPQGRAFKNQTHACPVPGCDWVGKSRSGAASLSAHGAYRVHTAIHKQPYMPPAQCRAGCASLMAGKLVASAPPAPARPRTGTPSETADQVAERLTPEAMKALGRPVKCTHPNCLQRAAYLLFDRGTWEGAAACAPHLAEAIESVSESEDFVGYRGDSVLVVRLKP